MKITQLDHKDKDITTKLDKAWRSVDLKHYGREIDEWKVEEIFLYVGSKESPTGYLFANVQMGVCYISELVVVESQRGKGIGKLLMNRAEHIAIEKGAHNIYLTTGKNWDERKFYEKLGYQKTADLKNHFLGEDFIHLTKTL